MVEFLQVVLSPPRPRFYSAVSGVRHAFFSLSVTVMT